MYLRVWFFPFFLSRSIHSGDKNKVLRQLPPARRCNSKNREKIPHEQQKRQKLAFQVGWPAVNKDFLVVRFVMLGAAWGLTASSFHWPPPLYQEMVVPNRTTNNTDVYMTKYANPNATLHNRSSRQGRRLRACCVPQRIESSLDPLPSLQRSENRVAEKAFSAAARAITGRGVAGITGVTTTGKR